MTHRLIQLRDELAHLADLAGRVLNQERIGALIDGHLTARRKQGVRFRHRLARRRRPEHRMLRRARGHRLDGFKKRGDVLGLGIINLDQLRYQGFEFDDRPAGLKRRFFLGGHFRGRRNGKNIALAAHGEVLAVNNKIQRLVPRDVFQAQREAAGHRVAHDKVQPGEIGQHLEGGAHFDILKIKRQLLSRVSEFIDFLFTFLFDDRFNADGKDVARLVGDMLILAFGSNDHAGVLTLHKGVDGLNRGGEVDHIQAPLKLLRDRGVQKVEDDLARLFPDINADGRLGQINNDLGVPLGTPAKIDGLQAVLARLTGAYKTRHPGLLGPDNRADRRRYGQNKIVAFDACGIGHRFNQVEHHPRAVLRFNDFYAGNRTFSYVNSFIR